MAERLPDRIGRYQIRRVLGRGGMGVVYEGFDPELRRPVAVKMILGRAFADLDAEDVARFVREAKATGRLDHPAVVRVFDADVHRGAPFIVMDFIDGESLADRIARRSVTPRQAAGFVRDVCAALAAAHEAGIVHRDVKPANILIDREGRALLTDFGLARDRRDQALTASGIVLGTPAYMAPEQAEGSPGLIGPACDVWAAGAVLYHCLTGRPPYEGEDAIRTIAMLVSRPVTPPRERVPDLPERLCAIVMGCLEHDPARRFASARDVGDALEGWLSGRASMGPRPRPPEPALPPAPARSGAATAVAAAVVSGALALAAGAWIFGSRRDTAGPIEARSETERSAATATAPAPTPAPAPAPPGAAAPPASEPDPTTHGARAREEAEEGARLWLEQRLDAARAALDRAIALDPTLAVAWRRRAAVRVDQGDLAGAVEDFDRAIELAPTSAEGWADRGVAKRRLGDARGAIADLDRALELDPTSAPTWSNRSLARRDAGEVEGAIADATRAIELDGRHADSWNNRGIARAVARELEEALLDFDQAIALDPGRARFHRNRGLVLAQLRRLEESRAAYDRAISLDPGDPHTWTLRALVHADRGAPDAAESDFGRALALDPDYLDALLGRALLRSDRGDVSAARADLERFLRVAPASDPRIGEVRARLRARR